MFGSNDIWTLIAALQALLLSRYDERQQIINELRCCATFVITAYRQRRARQDLWSQRGSVDPESNAEAGNILLGIDRGIRDRGIQQFREETGPIFPEMQRGWQQGPMTQNQWQLPCLQRSEQSYLWPFV